MAERLSTDLLSDPAFPEVGDMPENIGETPYHMAFGLLSSLRGEKLQIMTRANPGMAQAINVAYNMIASFGSQYIAGEIDTIMRLGVSMKGEGRKEIVDSLRAGGDMPDAYYEATLGGGRNNTPRTFTDAVDDEDD